MINHDCKHCPHFACRHKDMCGQATVLLTKKVGNRTLVVRLDDDGQIYTMWDDEEIWYSESPTWYVRDIITELLERLEKKEPSEHIDS